ncbi:unnamed protein product, partial [Closterium sp. NIES-54]
YVAATEVGKVGRRLRFLLAEFQQLDAGTPTVLRVDNKLAITVAKGMGLTGNLKHMERRQAWLRDMVKRGKFLLRYILTPEQPADFLTKALHYPAFNRCSVEIHQPPLLDLSPHPGVGGTGAGDPGAGGTGAGGIGAGGARPGGPAARGTGAGGAGATSPGGAGVTAGAGGPGGAGAAGPGGARTRDTGAVGAGGVGGTRSGDPGAGGTGAGDPGAGSTGAGDRAGAGDPGAGGAGPGGAGAGGSGAGGTVQRRPFFVPPPPSSLSHPDSVLCQPDSPLPAPSPYAKQTDSLKEHREPESHPSSPVRAVRTCRRVPRPRPPSVPSTHHMALRPSFVPLQVPLQSSPTSSLADGPDPESDLVRAARPIVPLLLAAVLPDPSFEFVAAAALVAELVDFAAACRLDYAASLVAESESDCPPSVGGECALRTDVLEDMQEDFECFATTIPHLVAMLLAPEETRMHQTSRPCALTQRRLQVPTPLSGIQPWTQRWHPGSPHAPTSTQFPLLGQTYQRQGVDFFLTFYPTPKMTTLRVVLHVAAQRDYELHSLDFSADFFQGSLHEEIWLRRPPGFTGSFPAGTQWSLRRPVYGLRQGPREWHDTLRTTLAALGFAPSTADPSLFLHTDTSLPSFYVLVYIDDLVFATTDTEALTLVKSELQKRYTCTDLGELRSYLCLQITRDRARSTITMTRSYKSERTNENG